MGGPFNNFVRKYRIIILIILTLLGIAAIAVAT